VITLKEALLIRECTYGSEWPSAGKVRETDSYWWIGDCQPVIGSRGVIIDKADGHVHRLGSALTLKEWFFAHERGFRHRDYCFRVTTVHNVDLTLRLLWDMRYTHIKVLVGNPPFDLPFSWLGYRFLAAIASADFFDCEFTVTACDHDKCTAIGTLLPPFCRRFGNR